MLSNWIKKHRDFLKKSGGMEAKQDSINLKNRISSKILENLDKRAEDRRQVPDRRVNGGEESDNNVLRPLPI